MGRIHAQRPASRGMVPGLRALGRTALGVLVGAALTLRAAPASAPPSEEGDFALQVVNEGEDFVELEWQGTSGFWGEVVGWFVHRRPLHGGWSIVTPWLYLAENDPGPYQWIDRGRDARVYEYKVTEILDVFGTLRFDVESDVVRADSDARVPGFVAPVGHPIVIEAEAWRSREDGAGGKAWTVDASPPAGAVGDVLAALPDDESGSCPSTPTAETCPRLDYRVVFPESGVYTVWVRGFAADASDEGVLIGLDGVALERVATSWSYGAWSWASGPLPDQLVALDVPTPGEHVVHLWMSEDGARVDRFALARDAAWRPTPPASPTDPGLPESARSSRVFVTRLARSECSAPVVVECPAGYQVVGGGIDFPDKHQRCSAWDPVEGEFVEAHRKFFGFSTYPEGNGWYCRGESREVDCYAVCAHAETTGITSASRTANWMWNGNSTSDVSCPVGKSPIAGGYHSESFWEIPKKKEEYKVLGQYHDGDDWRCDDQSRDHYGFCFGLCVDDGELVAADVVETPSAVQFLASCPEGYRAVGGGFGFCSDQSCSASLDEIEARPMLESDEYRCRVGFKESSRGVVAPECQATCIRDELGTVPVAVPEPGGVLQLVSGLVGLAALKRRRSRCLRGLV